MQNVIFIMINPGNKIGNHTALDQATRQNSILQKS